MLPLQIIFQCHLRILSLIFGLFQLLHLNLHFSYFNQQQLTFGTLLLSLFFQLSFI